MGSEYITLFQAMRGVLRIVSLMKEIIFLLELQRDTTKALCILFKTTVTVHEDSQGVIAIAVAPQTRPSTKNTTI